MTRIVLLSFALLSLALAVTTDQRLNTILAQVQEEPFGKAVGALIEMNMKAQASTQGVKEISDLLEEMRNSLALMSESAKTAIESRRGYCDEQKGLFDKAIDGLSSTLKDNKQELSDLNDEEKAKSGDLLTEKANKEQQTVDLDNANNDLKTENDQYTEHHASFEEAIIACEEAVRLLNQITTHVLTQPQNMMFVQLSKKFESVKDMIQKHVKKSSNAFIQPIIDILMELGSEGHIDTEKVNQIISLIKTLLQRLREGLRERELSHQTSVTDLNKLIEHLGSSINTSTNNVQILEQRLAEIQSRKKQLEGIITNLDETLTLKQKTLSQLRTDCANDEAAYASQSTKRQKQLDILDKLIEYFNTKIANL